MSIKELKAHGRLLLKKNNYWLNVAVVFFMTINIDDIISKFTTDYKALFSLFTPSNFNWENIKTFILNNQGDDSLSDIILSLAIILFEVLFLTILRVGGIRYFLKLRKNQSVKFTEIFSDFKNKTAGNIVAVSFVSFLSCMIWTFVFIIPGIIKICQYAAVEYILALRPDIDATEALDLSKTLMKGNKWKFFVLGLSFILWHILGMCSFDILGYLFVIPYQEVTFIGFFSNIRDEAIEKGIITSDKLPDYAEATQTV